MEINQEFIAAAEPLVNFLRKHKHPHAKIIVDQTGAELVEGTLSTGVAYDGSTPEQTGEKLRYTNGTLQKDNNYDFCTKNNLSIPYIEEVDEDEDDKIWNSIPSINKGDGIEQMYFGDGYYVGYKAAQSKGRYSEADVRKAIEKAHKLGSKGWEHSEKNVGEIIRSLKPKTEEVNSIYLHKDDFTKLEEVLLNPPEPNASLVKAYKRYKSFQSESRMYSEEEVCGFAEWFTTEDYIHRGMEDGEWFYRNVKNTKEELLRIYLNLFQPKTEELKEGLKPCPKHPDVLTSQCGICDGTFPKLEQPKTEEQTYGEWMRSNPEQPTSLLGGKYEAMNNAYKEINSPSIEELAELRYPLINRVITEPVNDKVHNLRNAFIEGYKADNRLEELEKVKKIEDWLREYPIDGGVIFVKDLLEYIQLIKH